MFSYTCVPKFNVIWVIYANERHALEAHFFSQTFQRFNQEKIYPAHWLSQLIEFNGYLS